MEGVLSIVLVVVAIASLVFAVVMAVRSGRGGEVDEEKMERRFEIVCVGVVGRVVAEGGNRAGVNEDVVVIDRVGGCGAVDCTGLSENNN